LKQNESFRQKHTIQQSEFDSDAYDSDEYDHEGNSLAYKVRSKRLVIEKDSEYSINADGNFPWTK